MRLRTLLVLSVLCATPVASMQAGARDEARRHVAFGIEVAGRGLWREAIYRWQRAIEIDPTYAEALNNLGIAYEHEGDLEKARTSYEKAVALAPTNQTIKQNYEQFKEINERANAAGEK